MTDNMDLNRQQKKEQIHRQDKVLVENRLEEFRKEVEAAGDGLNALSLPPVTEEVFGIYEKTGNRLTYEAVYFGRRKFLAVFGLLAIWYRRKEDITKLNEVILETCTERTWALPAHVDRSVPGWEKTVDLFACETGQTLAELVYLLSDVLPLETVELVRQQVVERLIDSYLAQPFGTIRWEKFRNNWVAVCAGCLGSMAIYLLENDKQKQEACLKRVIQTLPLYLEGMMEDGTCPEGMSYYTYGMEYYVGFADQLRTYSHGAVDLMDNLKVERIARFQQLCFLGGGCTVSFSDGDRKDKFRLGLTCYLAMRYPGVAIPPMESVMKLHDDTCYRFMALYRDGLWAEKYLKEENTQGCLKQETRRGNRWFSILSDAQWVIGKSDNGVGMAIKGGNNDEPHNHNDIGSFLYVKDGEVFLADLGCGEYTKDYFGGGRYQILCNRSLGHSVPLLNGKEQLAGKAYRAEEFRAWEEGLSAAAENLFDSGKNRTGNVEISMAQAYPIGIIRECSRKAVFEKAGGRLLITDLFCPSAESRTMTENLVTQLEPVIGDDQTVILKGEKNSISIRMAVIDEKEKDGCRAEECGRAKENSGAEERGRAKEGGWNVKKELFINHRGLPEDVWLLQWEFACREEPVACTVEIAVCQ